MDKLSVMELGLCIKTTSSYVHVPYPAAIFVSPSIEKKKKKPFEESAILSYTETSKPAYPLIFNYTDTTACSSTETLRNFFAS